MTPTTTAEQILEPVTTYATRRCAEYKLMKLRDVAPATIQCSTAYEAAAFYAEHVVKSPIWCFEKETLVVLFLNTRRKITGFHIASTGTLDTILIHPREVFRPAIAAGAHAIVLMHNHPSGDPTPSESDIKVTREMMKAGALLRIELLDHIVMGERSELRPVKHWASLRELGYLYAA